MRVSFVCIVLSFFSAVGVASNKPPAAAIASAHPLATDAGIEILEAGGNAFDAAVAVTAALAVVEPYSSGLGGGGFWLLHRAADNFNTMIDGRETAPAASTRDMYLDQAGNVVPGLSMDGPLSAGIPGVPAAIVYMSKKYGRLPLTMSLAPAIRLAREGFQVDEHYQRLANFRKEVLNRWPASAELFLLNNDVPPTSHRIIQTDLAKTLYAMSTHGAAGFYAGAIAERLVQATKEAGGIWTLDDLKNYRLVERRPIVGHYGHIKLISAPPPSSGGVALLTMLNILSGYDLHALPPVEQYHLVVEAMRRAYRDRAVYLGDADFVDVPVARLTSADYAAGLRASIRHDRALPSELLPGIEPEKEGPHTTHFSILDYEGNRVAATVTVNYPFGSGFVAQGTGVLLNDEMDDFSSKPGSPNAYGLVGAEANAIVPGKRPLSSMSPTFLESEKGIAILGTPGGSRIITMVLLGILDYAKGHGPDSWVSLGRYHHQYLPDVIEYEEGALTAEQIQQLQGLGHSLKVTRWPYGNMQAILWRVNEGEVLSASDPRGVGKAFVKSTMFAQK